MNLITQYDTIIFLSIFIHDTLQFSFYYYIFPRNGVFTKSASKWRYFVDILYFNFFYTGFIFQEIGSFNFIGTRSKNGILWIYYLSSQLNSSKIFVFIVIIIPLPVFWTFNVSDEECKSTKSIGVLAEKADNKSNTGILQLPYNALKNTDKQLLIKKVEKPELFWKLR